MWNLLPILAVFSVGLVTPGPDFSIVVKNSLGHGRKQGFFTALGIATGIVVHMSYCIFGLGMMLNRGSSLIVFIRLMGGVYLMYLGYKSFTSKPPTVSTKEDQRMRSHSAYLQGVITNLLNPNAVLFFISIFSAVLAKDTIQTAIALGISIVTLAFTWFSFVSYLFSIEIMVRKYLQFGTWMNRILGIVLVSFGLSILFKT